MSSQTEKGLAPDRKRARPVTPNKVVHSYRDFSRLPPGKSALDEADVKEFTTSVQEAPTTNTTTTTVPALEESSPTGKPQDQELSSKSKSATTITTAVAVATVTVIVPTKKCRGTYCNFPTKLHQILSSEEFSGAIAWMPHGRSFRVIKPKEFAENISPRFFNHSNFPSFARQVNGWGFRRLTQGPDRNSYYHELFLRWRPHLVKWMRRPEKVGKQMPDPANEPNFYSISERFPLPLPLAPAESETNPNSTPSHINEDETRRSCTNYPTYSNQHQHHYLSASPPRTHRFTASPPRHSPHRGDANKGTVYMDGLGSPARGHYDYNSGSTDVNPAPGPLFEPHHNRFSQHHPPHNNTFAPHYDSRLRGFQQEYFTPSSPPRRRESLSYGQQHAWGSHQYGYSPSDMERAMHFPHPNNDANYSSVPVKSGTRENNRIQFSTRPDTSAARQTQVLRDDNVTNNPDPQDKYDSSYRNQTKIRGTRPIEEPHVTYAMAHPLPSAARMGMGGTHRQAPSSRVRHGWIMRGASSVPGSPEIQKYVRDPTFDQQQGTEQTMHDPRHFEDHPRPYSRVVSQSFSHHLPANYTHHHVVSRGDMENESRLKGGRVWPLEAERDKIEELPHIEQSTFDFDVLVSKKESNNIFDK